MEAVLLTRLTRFYTPSQRVIKRNGNTLAVSLGLKKKTAAGVRGHFSFEVSDTTLAFDMIREIGPRGSFLGQRRTADELRRLWPMSILFEKSKVAEEKYRKPVEVAREAIDWIVNNHQPAPLDKPVEQELKEIVAAADHDENLRGEIRGQ